MKVGTSLTEDSFSKIKGTISISRRDIKICTIIVPGNTYLNIVAKIELELIRKIFYESLDINLSSIFSAGSMIGIVVLLNNISDRYGKWVHPNNIASILFIFAQLSI